MIRKQAIRVKVLNLFTNVRPISYLSKRIVKNIPLVCIPPRPDQGIHFSF